MFAAGVVESVDVLKEGTGHLLAVCPRVSFTIGQQSVLKIVADEVRRKGFCGLYLGEIAARAGVCLILARDTIREASFMGLLTIQERKQYRKPNLSNMVRIIGAEWKEWLFSRNFFLFYFLKSTLSKRDPRGEPPEIWWPRMRFITNLMERGQNLALKGLDNHATIDVNTLH